MNNYNRWGFLIWLALMFLLIRGYLMQNTLGKSLAELERQTQMLERISEQMQEAKP